MSSRRSVSREILALAIPSLGAMVAQPIFLLTDSAMVGALGTEPLASLGIAGTVVQTTVGLVIFLTYATTPLVARARGAGDVRGATIAGVQGLWIAAVLGLVLGVALWWSAPWLIGLFGAEPAVAAGATEFLTISAVGIPAALVGLAATGFLRGFGDARTPLRVALAGFALNAVLNAVLIFGAGWGLAGSAVGTVVAQYAMTAVLLLPLVTRVRQSGAPMTPGIVGLQAVASSGSWLLLRTLSLRISIVWFVAVAATMGSEVVAAVHIVSTILGFIALVLDALEVPAQTMVGEGLGAGDGPRVRRVARTIVVFAMGTGAVLGAVLAATAWLIPWAFTRDQTVADLITAGLVVVATSLPMAGFVFALDGILIGAGDGKYLAATGALNLAMAAPGFVIVGAMGHGLWGIVSLHMVWSYLYLGSRALTLGIRARGNRWMVFGR